MHKKERPEKMIETISCKLTPRERGQLEAIAAHYQCSYSEYIRAQIQKTHRRLKL